MMEEERDEGSSKVRSRRRILEAAILINAAVLHGAAILVNPPSSSKPPSSSSQCQMAKPELGERAC